MAIRHTIKSKSGDLVVVDLTRKRAIKFFCYECMGWQKAEVRHCTAETCPLYPFRPLKNAPFFAQGSTIAVEPIEEPTP